MKWEKKGQVGDVHESQWQVKLSLESSDHWITLKMMGELFTSPFGAQRMLDHEAVVVRNRRK